MCILLQDIILITILHVIDNDKLKIFFKHKSLFILVKQIDEK